MLIVQRVDPQIWTTVVLDETQLAAARRLVFNSSGSTSYEILIAGKWVEADQDGYEKAKDILSKRGKR